jgi:hypothetical protein
MASRWVRQCTRRASLQPLIATENESEDDELMREIPRPSA